MANQTLYTFKANLQDLVKLQKEIAKAQKELNKLKKTDAEYQAQQKKLAGLQGQFNKTAGAMKNATGAAQNLNKAGGKLINTFKSAAVAIGAAFAVRAIVGSIKNVISAFAEFETQMAAVKAISGATEQEFKQLEDSALKLGSSTVFTATEVAKLQEEFARLGFTVDEIDAATQSTLNLAAATGESLANSAQIAGSTLRAFNLDAEQTQRVTDVMAESFTNSALNLDRFKESMKFVAPVARATGFTLEETSSLLMQLADNGLSGSIAGNALKNIFLKLGDANSKLARTLGGPVQGIPDLVEAMRKLKEEGFDTSDAVELLDKRSAPAFLALMSNIDGLQDSVDVLNMTEGAVNRMAAIRLDTLQGDFTLLKSAAEGLSIALGDQFDNSLRSTVYSLTNFIQKITKSETALKAIQRTVQFLVAALVGLTARFAAMGFAAFISGITQATRAIGVMVTTLRAATVSTKALKTAFASTPWGFIAQVVTTVAASFLLMGDEADEAAMKTERLTDALNQQLDSILDMGVGTKERSNAMRQLANDFPELLRFLDLELATNEQLLEIRQLMGSADVVGMQERIKDNNQRLTLLRAEDQAQIDSYNKQLVGLRELHEEKKKAYGEDSQAAREAQIDITRIENRRNVLQLPIRNLEKQNKALLESIDGYVRDLAVSYDVIIDEGDTYRMKLRVQYMEELKSFRKYNQTRQEAELKSNEDRLAYVEQAVEYNSMVGESIRKFGEITPLVQKQIDLFLDNSGFKDKILSDATSAEKLGVELSELRKFVSNLDSVYTKAGGAADDFGEKAGFALNKTKDQYKKLSKLLDDLIDDQFKRAEREADATLSASIKANDEQIRLMETNIRNIGDISDKGNKKELAALIKANKTKFEVLKNLSFDQYEMLTDGEKGNKEEMLKILDEMIKEEQTKRETAFEYERTLYETHFNELEKIAIERELAQAQIIAESGELEQRQLERNELNFFKVMKNRKDIREKLATDTINNILDQEQRRFINLDKQLEKGVITEEEYGQRKVEIARETQNQINAVTQDGLDQNVQDQLTAIEKISEYYTMAFDAFSTFFSNKMELEKQKTNEFYSLQQQDLDTSLQRELEAVEGNAEAQEDIRERYALIQEANEEKKQQALLRLRKKEFQVQKVNDIIQATINGALAITKAAAQTGVGAAVAAPIISTLVAAQIAAIAAQKFVGEKGGVIPEFAKGGMVYGPSHADGGVKFSVGGRVAELEGGEAVINKNSTSMFKSQLSAMNVAGGGVAFANGGIMPGTSNALQASGVNNTQIQLDTLASSIISGINSKEVVVTESSITTSQQNVSVTELTSNLF